MAADRARTAQLPPTIESRVGPLLRRWRERRRMSQLDLASVAAVSTRHLSYVETGRSTPSRELIIHLATHLDVPHREQNDLLLAAGYAPAYVELDLDDPAMEPVVATLDAMLAASEPNPTIVMDRYWNLVRANESALAWTSLIDPALLGPPLNVLRATFHPDGLAAHITNHDAVAAHLLGRVRRQLAITGDPLLADLLTELEGLAPDATTVTTLDPSGADGTPAVIVRMRIDGLERAYLSVVSTFGATLDVTASELVIESFYAIDR